MKIKYYHYLHYQANIKKKTTKTPIMRSMTKYFCVHYQVNLI